MDGEVKSGQKDRKKQININRERGREKVNTFILVEGRINKLPGKANTQKKPFSLLTKLSFTLFIEFWLPLGLYHGQKDN